MMMAEFVLYSSLNQVLQHSHPITSKYNSVQKKCFKGANTKIL